MSTDDIWRQLSFLESEPTARRYLSTIYKDAGVDHPEKTAFQQSNRFLYTWLQGRQYYQLAEQSNLLVKPLLLFYGCVHLLKAYAISKDPAYPPNSRVLQHGVTTRKIKKSPYQFLEDDVKPQKEGFFTYLCSLLPNLLVMNRFRMIDLFTTLPTMYQTLLTLGIENSWVPISCHGTRPYILSFPFDTKGALAYSSETFLHFLNRIQPANQEPFTLYMASPDSTSLTDSTLMATGRSRNKLICCANKESVLAHPLLHQGMHNSLLFWNHTESVPLPSHLIHFLILYVCSMLCRYDSEWWGDMIISHQYMEKILLDQYCQLHEVTFPIEISRLMKIHIHTKKTPSAFS
ncbi:YaaC family protein [Brevibacillus daliensis]|uniref:YaaC family protein n=1 Tax=Brevibacillus daliensis TaxID=2892995 RepID=UPI001E34464D|nr:YaaC family protein [Brevibacillus daliensis]